MAELGSQISLVMGWAIAPGFLWAGGVLMAIPIIIHILNRRRYRVVQWAAMEYLLAALRKNRRRLRFEQIVLLITRCAVLGLLGLALSRPLGCSDSSIASLAGNRAGLHVFVIDNSYSMAYEADRAGAKTHLDQAKLLAKQQIDQLAAGGESVVVITAGREPAAKEKEEAGEAHVVLRASYDLEAAKGAVDRIEQSYSGTDLVGALQAATQVAREKRDQPAKYLYVLTDFTRSAWESRDAGALKPIGAELASVFGSHIRIHNLGRAGQWNYAVLDVRADGNLVTNKFHTDFLADIKGFGSGGDAMVQWRWDDQVVGDGGRVRPDLGTEVQRQTKAQITEGGEHVLSVALASDDKLRMDNVRQRVIEVASELRVLIVEGERGAGLLSGSGAFLDLAMAPKREIGPGGVVRNDSYVSPELISDLELSSKVFGDYRAVILANVSGVSATQADQLKKFVEMGGTLMVFMGEQVNPDAYNSVLLPRGLMPGKLVARKTVAADTKGFTLDFKPNGVVHPLLSVFKGEERSGLDTAQVFTYYQVEMAPAARAEVVLRYLAGDKQTNDPAITVQRLGEGRVVMVSTTANPDWTSLPPKPAYPALVHELLAGNVDVGDRWMNLEVGQEVVVPAGVKLNGVPVLTDAEKKQIPLEVVNGEGRMSYHSRALKRPGLYRLNTGAKTLPIAVNVPADEADVRLLPAEAIRKTLGDVEVQFAGDELPAGALAHDEGTDFGWAIMVAVLGLVGAECVMAMRFGHYRRK